MVHLVDSTTVHQAAIVVVSEEGFKVEEEGSMAAEGDTGADCELPCRMRLVVIAKADAPSKATGECHRRIEASMDRRMLSSVTSAAMQVLELHMAAVTAAITKGQDIDLSDIRWNLLSRGRPKSPSQGDGMLVASLASKTEPKLFVYGQV